MNPMLVRTWEEGRCEDRVLLPVLAIEKLVQPS